MSDTICDSTVSPAANSGKPARSSKRPPTPIRPTRLQIEQLENRDVMTAVLDVPVAETASSVMQASCMSAFFQQSSLFDNGQPATFPTVTWTTRDDQKREEPVHAQQMEAPERLTDRFEQESNELPRGLRGPQNSPNQSSRSTGGLRKLLRADGAWPSHVFAPYVDMSSLPTYDLIDAAESQGLLYFNLSSITADSQNKPSWGGNNARAIDGGPFDTALRQQITRLRALGGDVAVSFGGAKGTELAQAISSVEDLKNAYREVVDAYGLQRIDFDLSAEALSDAASVERRSMAVSELQRDLAATGHKLHVWMTLPATRSGLTDAGLHAVQSAQRHGVELDGVNLKTTDDGNETAPETQPRAGRQAIEAAINAFYELRSVMGVVDDSAGTWAKIGITPTIGQRGPEGQDFNPQDARGVYSFAEQQGVGMIGMWTINRDQPSAGTSSPALGGVDENAFEFSDIFLPFSTLLTR